MSELLQDLIALREFLTRLEDICEEARDADGICVVLQDQSLGCEYDVLLVVRLRIGCIMS
jgi:hypothetical protein